MKSRTYCTRKISRTSPGKITESQAPHPEYVKTRHFAKLRASTECGGLSSDKSSSDMMHTHTQVIHQLILVCHIEQTEVEWLLMIPGYGFRKLLFARRGST
jgi:hypothetical protein